MDVDRSENEIKKEKQFKQLQEESGLSLTTSIFFVVGDVVGAGVVALPYSMKLVGYLGIPMFMMCSLLMCYCAILLAKACATVMRDIDRRSLRDPYPRVGLEATGKFGRYVTIFALFVNQVLTCIVFVLLAGEILLELIPSTPWDHYSYRMQLRIWFMICGMVLLPFTFLGSPKDFAGIGFMAMATSGVAIALVIVMLAYVSGYTVDNEKTMPKTMDGFLHAFGTVLFGFGGVSIFPTIQADMKKPDQFVTSVTVGYIIISIFYVVTPLTAYIILGDLIREDLLTTFSYLELYFTNHLFRTFCMAAQACICGHVLCAFVLNINPVYQQFEALVGIPTDFCWQRVISRTFWMFFILFTAVVIPAFGPVLSFVGGSFAALLGVILPVVFYARLSGNLPLWKEILFVAIILVALFGSVGNGYVEIKNIIKVIGNKYNHHG
uniref:Amino acid transporter transmembrane domain-containing protein n=2 Tax=Clytia hemisphaerica TaxID=252671 RepID=A0A7M5UWV5_9CNID